MACSIVNAFDIICSLDRDGKLDDAPQHEKQKVATLGLSPNGLRKFWDRSVDTELRTTCST